MLYAGLVGAGHADAVASDDGWVTDVTDVTGHGNGTRRSFRIWKLSVDTCSERRLFLSTTIFLSRFIEPTTSGVRGAN